MKKYKRVMNCECGKTKGRKIIPNSHSLSFGIAVDDLGEYYDGVFQDAKAVILKNNFCPECGTKISKVVVEEVYEEEDKSDSFDS